MVMIKMTYFLQLHNNSYIINWIMVLKKNDKNKSRRLSTKDNFYLYLIVIYIIFIKKNCLQG